MKFVVRFEMLVYFCSKTLQSIAPGHSGLLNTHFLLAIKKIIDPMFYTTVKDLFC